MRLSTESPPHENTPSKDTRHNAKHSKPDSFIPSFGRKMTMPKIVTEFADAICAECLDIIVNADPDNMGWTLAQYDEWLTKFDAYCDGEAFTIVPADYNDPETGTYFARSGCPICSDGLGNDVYPVIVIGF